MTDYWGDENKLNENFPHTVRSEFNANTSWAWHHWRGSLEYDSNKKTFNIDVPELSWVLEAPNRVPWGIIALKNASTYEMAHNNNKILTMKADLLSLPPSFCTSGKKC